ncbi:MULTISPECIES: DUF255 domain-containing protein [unclassified Brevibacterium]|uniref:thioredoxin domain-containing protein n=1 Tax=unclassified Brevibacterium TaxID=2614124 RepID=UPI0010F599EA|nr:MULTISPECIES: DUF255 domain-containing protein [unclassified Brevibacterium]MCM1012915.1 DUF255 domain-containing protein [Brevibacterium sp. XM4083]
MANELAASTSPYLRAHADNPVDWRMWTKESLAEAADRDIPLLISIGYSTCHWCHVMAHESFEDPAVAEIINAGFLPIKIDREELPDIDSHYMNALQAMRGQGGWPMTIFATPTGSPFYAGTYFPPSPRGNVPSFTQVLDAVSQTWTDRRAEVTEMSQRMDRGLADMATAVTDAIPAEAAAETLTSEELDAAASALLDSYDPAWGGFGTAPKFPPSMNLMQLLATFVRHGGTTSAKETDGIAVLGADGHLTGDLTLDCLIAARSTFAHIASGGMRDQVRGGIARYSVDRQWFVPHFEKMLYDNAVYLRAVVRWAEVERALDPASKWLALAERELADTADFMIADLSAGDRFVAALDADSPGADGRLEEGAAYVVTQDEFAEVGGAGVLQLVDSPAGADLPGLVVAAPRIVDWLGMADVPFDAEHPAPWATEATQAQVTALRTLLDARPQPARDEKTITEWNALAITALAEAALYSHPSAASAAWGSTAAIFWESMVNRFITGSGDIDAEPAEVVIPGVGDLPVRRSFTGADPGPGAAGLTDWAQMIVAGAAVLQLRNAGLGEGVGKRADTAVALDDTLLTPAGLAELGTEMLRRFTNWDAEAGAGRTSSTAGAGASGGGGDAVETLEVFDAEADDILGVRGSDPVDNATPSGRAAAAEAMLLLGELGVDGGTPARGRLGEEDPTVGQSEATLTSSQAIDVRDRLLGVYRALAGRAPRGAGHALWQAERALAPVRVASRDDALLTLAAKHPAVTLLTDSTGVPGPDGDEIPVPEGAAIVCRGTVCSLPVTTTAELAALLDG